jgi:hypothetical protein
VTGFGSGSTAGRSSGRWGSPVRTGCVHLTYGAESGYALIDRALYLAQDWAADDERRELAHVPNELCFATNPQLLPCCWSVPASLGCRPGGWPPTR